MTFTHKLNNTKLFYFTPLPLRNHGIFCKHKIFHLNIEKIHRLKNKNVLIKHITQKKNKSKFKIKIPMLVIIPTSIAQINPT